MPIAHRRARPLAPPPDRPRRLQRRPGHTLPELLVVLALVSLGCALALGAARALLDRTRARMAAADLVGLLADARDRALAEGGVVAARVDTGTGAVTLRAGPDTLARRALGRLHGVRIAATRDSVAYSALGVGRGLANARFVLARGLAAETVWVSRLGRVRTGGAP